MTEATNDNLSAIRIGVLSADISHNNDDVRTASGRTDGSILPQIPYHGLSIGSSLDSWDLR